MSLHSLRESWYIETLNGRKIAALLNPLVTSEDRTLEAPRCILYVDEMLMTFGHTVLADIPEVNIIHERREDNRWCKTIFRKAFLLEIPKQYPIGGDLIMVPDLKYEYQISEETKDEI